MFTLTLERVQPVPTYTYTCTACNDIIEKRQSFSDPPLTTCEQCGGALRKVIHPVGIVFKGSGWYITDSRSSSSSSSSSSSASGSEPAKTSPSTSNSNDSSATSSPASPSSSSSSSSPASPSSSD
jgi:putative FmdB family regulatory protein